ncbi:hypothetical protein VTL71DRAFT_5794 [Oculimacula yallundae]|uniref:Beta-lactamase-related domain-containing protein n=1 Tax=Oculimacula yallundae TaxID=86028 RepID=A0ABR4BYM7_9HELO
MATQSFEQKLQQAIDNGEVVGAVLSAGNRDGSFRYEKAFGYRSLKDRSPMKLDAVMWMASCTKLITSIAALQCVERGLLNLDDDVSEILPELKGLKILTGFEEKDRAEEPILVENSKAVTLRHLLTHSSGLSYDFINPLLTRYRKWQKRTPNLNIESDIKDAFLFPLVFAPGEAFEYGVGIDWAGWMVERVAKTSLDTYFRQNLWDPLGVQGFTFHPQQKPDLWSRMTDMSDREGGMTMFGTAADPNGKIVHHEGKEVWNSSSKECAGGVGSYGAVVDYQVMLHSILADDGKLLKPATVDEMFKSQLTQASRASLMAQMNMEVNISLNNLPKGTECDWGFGGMLTMQDLAGRKKGTLVWGGFPNLLWFIDRVGGMSGIYGSQLNPPGDIKTSELFVEWEKELYKNA